MGPGAAISIIKSWSSSQLLKQNNLISVPGFFGETFKNKLLAPSVLCRSPQ